jgi:hypothetical protein
MRIGDLAPNATVNKDVPWYQQILQALPALGTTYLSIKQQGELNKLNLQRANQGLPAIETQDYQAGVQVGVSRSTQNTILLVAAGLGGAYVLSQVLGGRRR